MSQQIGAAMSRLQGHPGPCPCAQISILCAETMRWTTFSGLVVGLHKCGLVSRV